VGEASTSKLASTREAVTLACCPPGPEERLARTVTSERGIVSSPLIRSRRRGPSRGLTADRSRSAAARERTATPRTLCSALPRQA
jgi:hypothetical protein